MCILFVISFVLTASYLELASMSIERVVIKVHLTGDCDVDTEKYFINKVENIESRTADIFLPTSEI